MNDPADKSALPALGDRLRAVCVGLREDLEVSRHLFRGIPSYIVRDPLTFQSQRLGIADYEVLVNIRVDRTLGDVFQDLVDRGTLGTEDEERYYQFIMTLHRLGFLRLPISNVKALYQRFLLREQAKRKGLLGRILFLRIPLLNPNAFLDRTINYVRPFFSRTCFFFWLLLVASACVVAYRRWDDLLNPLHGTLAARNLPLIWITLVVLKVFHEFGHAFACKNYGGHVPEMGAYMIMFTPCAYVDATASWGFSRKWERLVVCFAGMYVETAIAAVALFVWAATPTSLINSLAFNVIFLASAVTILFNVNPLMRYDGYYVFSDVLEIPNLRQRASRRVADVLKKLFLAIPIRREQESPILGAVLFGYGVAAVVYRLGIMIAIAAILASKILLLGAVLGAFMIVSTVASVAFKLTNFLWHARETAGRRRRAIALSLITLIVLPATILWMPIPSTVQVPALLAREHETVIRAETPGFLERVHIVPGATVEPVSVVAQLTNDGSREQVARAETNLLLSRIRGDALQLKDAARESQFRVRQSALQKVLEESRRKADALCVRAGTGGLVADCARDDDIGRFFPQGASVATIVSGSWHARSILTQTQRFESHPQPGDRVEFRAAALPAVVMGGEILRIAPAGSHRIEFEPLTNLGGGEIAVSPETSEAAEPYFEITVRLDDEAPHGLLLGMTGYIRLGGSAEPLGTVLARRTLRFWNRL